MFRSPVTVGVGAPSLEDVVAVARDGAAVELSPEALAEIGRSRDVIDALAADVVPHYGVSTGFGALATLHIPVEKRLELQRGLIRSHAAGSGDEVEREVVRALMLLRLSTLATGRTGVRPVVATSYAALLSAGITPVVHEYGSLGCSGDLAPLAHCALALMGEGPVRDATGTLRDAGDALREAGIEPVVLAEKEGLALINGTDGMLGMLVLAIADLRDAAGDRRHRRRHERRGPARHRPRLRRRPARAAAAGRPGARRRPTCARCWPAARSSPRTAGPRTRACRTRTRCAARRRSRAPRATPSRTRAVAERELAAAIDNPVVTRGRPRRVQRQLPRRPDRLRARLPGDRRRRCGIDGRAPHRPLPRRLAQPRPAAVPGRGSRASTSGYMIAQYTQAAIVSELKRLAVPASVDSIPSSAMQEDHVSMGWSAGRKLRRALDGLTRVLAIELLTAARGIDLRAPLQPADATGAVLAALRATCAGAGADRFLAPEIEAAVAFVRDGGAVRAAESVTGPLEVP